MSFQKKNSQESTKEISFLLCKFYFDNDGSQ